MRLGTTASTETAGLLRAAGFAYLEPAVTGLLDPRVDEPTFQERKQAFFDAAGGPVAEVFNCFYPGELKITGPDVDVDALRSYAAIAARRAVELDPMRERALEHIDFLLEMPDPLHDPPPFLDRLMPIIGNAAIARAVRITIAADKHH